MRHRLTAFLLACALTYVPVTQAATTDEDVNYLLEHTAESGCTFVRDGVRHDAAEAAAHLRAQYAQDRSHIRSAEQFIDRMASADSLNGQPYVVSCGGKTQTSREWLNTALVNYQVNRSNSPDYPLN